MSRYLVTGATGFLGRHVVSALRLRGDDVVALARHVSPRFGDDTGARVCRGDVLDSASLDAAVAECDGVFHCAGRVSRNPADAEALHRLHVVGTRNVLAAARRAHVKRVVVASTSGTVAIRETDGHAINEGAPTPVAIIQRFPYYRSKLYAEQEALAENRDGLEVICVNPSLLLGPGDVNGSSTEDVRLFLDRAIPAVPAGGVSFVDVRDAAAGMLLAMDRGEPGRRYLLSGCNVSVRGLFDRLERVSGVAAPRIPMPRSIAMARTGTEWLGRLVALGGGELPVSPTSVEMGQLFWYADSARAERELGWRARDPSETLVDTVREIRGPRAG